MFLYILFLIKIYIVHILFIGMSFIPSANAFPLIKFNNQYEEETKEVKSIDDLPDLKIINIQHSHIINVPPQESYYKTFVRIHNIGNVSINGEIFVKKLVYQRIGADYILVKTWGPFKHIVDLASDEGEWIHLVTSESGGRFLKFVIAVNRDGNLQESNYSNNVAAQQFMKPFWYPYGYWKIGKLFYPETSTIHLKYD